MRIIECFSCKWSFQELIRYHWLNRIEVQPVPSKKQGSYSFPWKMDTTFEVVFLEASTEYRDQPGLLSCHVWVTDNC